MMVKKWFFLQWSHRSQFWKQGHISCKACRIYGRRLGGGGRAIVIYLNYVEGSKKDGEETKIYCVPTKCQELYINYPHNNPWKCTRLTPLAMVLYPGCTNCGKNSFKIPSGSLGLGPGWVFFKKSPQVIFMCSLGLIPWDSTRCIYPSALHPLSQPQASGSLCFSS